MPNKQPSKKFIHLLLLFCLIFPVWVILVEFGMQEVYFKPLCQNHAIANNLTFQTYNRGGRTSPPSCIMNESQIPITTIDGQTAQTIYIGTDIVAVLLPFFGIFFIPKLKKTVQSNGTKK